MSDDGAPFDFDAEGRAALSSVSFAVYAPEGLPVEVSGWSDGGGTDDRPGPGSIFLRHDGDDDDHRSIDVESARADGPCSFEDAQRAAMSRLAGGADAAVPASAPVTLRIDGVEVPCAYAASGTDWVAVATVGDVALTVEASGLSKGAVHLRALADPGDLRGGAVPRYRPARRARKVLDAARVRDLAAGTSIEDLGIALAAQAAPALALLIVETAGSSWIGGAPALPAGESWPVGVHGPMTFVLQLALSELDPAVWTGPRTGNVHVFADVDPKNSAIEHAGGCAVLHTPSGVELVPVTPPADLGQDQRLPQRWVAGHVGLTLPDEDAPAIRALGLSFSGRRRADADAYWTLKDRLHAEQGWHHQGAQLLGWPTWQNDDNMRHLTSLRGGEDLDWSLLLQTDALDAELYVVVAQADLAAGRFDRAEATVEHD